MLRDYAPGKNPGAFNYFFNKLHLGTSFIAVRPPFNRQCLGLADIFC